MSKFKYLEPAVMGLFFIVAPTFALAQTPPPLVITTTSPIPAVHVQQSVSVPLGLSGGVGPYTWSEKSLSTPQYNLPPLSSFGLNVDPSTGVISGTPNKTGNETFAVQVTDAVGQTTSATFSLQILPATFYSRTPSADFVANPVTFHMGGTFGVDFCTNGNTGYQLSTEDFFNPLTQSPSFSHAYGDAVDDTWTATLPVGTQNAIYVLCDSSFSQRYEVEGSPNEGFSPTGNSSPAFTIAATPFFVTAPLLSPVLVGQSVSQSIVVREVDYSAAPFTYTVTDGSLPSGLSLDASTGLISGTPTAATSSTFTIQAVDTLGQTVSQVFTWFVFTPLAITTTSLPQGLVGSTYSQTLGIINSVAPTVWSLSSGVLPNGMSIDPSTGVISGSPTTAGTFNFIVKVTDANSQVATKALVIVVAIGNQAPTLSPIGNKTVDEGQTLSFTLSATDPDSGDTLTYSASNLPSGATFDPATRVFTWKPNYGQAGNYNNVEFTVMDNGTPMMLAFEDITITVGHVNRAPVFSPIGSQQVLEHNLLTFTVSATDPDGDAVALSAVGLPSGATFDSSTGVFSWTPGYPTAGVYTPTFIATDNGTPTIASSSVDVVITVGSNPTPTEQSQTLINNVVTTNLPTSTTNSYLANLNKVGTFIEQGKVQAAINQLNAYIQKVNQDYTHGTITLAEKNQFIAEAQALITALQ